MLAKPNWLAYSGAMENLNAADFFQSLSPDTVLNLAESALDIRLNNLCRPLNSYINRVYELMADDGTGYVIKFYRPGRWRPSALQDEHNFLQELAEVEVPVIAPLTLFGQQTLGEYKHVSFAIFPKKGGRTQDEFNEDQWLELGRLLGRTHNVGASHLPEDRITLTPDKSTRDNIKYLLDDDFIPPEQRDAFADACSSLLDEISPYFAGQELIRIHGDCHFSNLIYRPDESFYLIDFDDMAIGPPIHDLWMLLPGPLSGSLYEIDLFMEGYETFRPFNRTGLRLIEPLRAMRFIHFAAWCARQKAEGGFTALIPDWGDANYWIQETNDLLEQIDRIRSGDELPKFF